MKELKERYNSILRRSNAILKELDKPVYSKMGKAKQRYKQAEYDELYHEMMEIIGQLESKGHNPTMDEIVNGFGGVK